MHKLLIALIAGLLVTFQPVHAASTAADADSIAAIVTDFDAFNRAQDPVRAAQRGDKEAARIWPDNSPPAVAVRTPSRPVDRTPAGRHLPRFPDSPAQPPTPGRSNGSFFDSPRVTRFRGETAPDSPRVMPENP